MQSKKLISSILVIFILIVCIFILNLSRPQNDIASMEKMISKQIKTKQTVTVFNGIVIDDYELVGYLIEKKQEYQKFGHALFKINRDGNYQLVNIMDADKTVEMASDIMVHEFFQLKVGNFTLPSQLVVISNNPQLAKIERIIENGEIQTKEVTSNPSISIFEDLDGDLNAIYNFYNKDGNIIK